MPDLAASTPTSTPTSTPDAAATAATRSAAHGLLITLLLLSSLVGLAAGAAARSGSEPAASAPAGLSATARLVDVTMDPDPLARYEVFVDNRSVVPVTVISIAVQHGTHPPEVLSDRHELAPSSSALIPLDQPLECATDADEVVSVRLVVQADTLEASGTSEGVPLNAVASGLAINHGPCALASTTLPPGWPSTATAEAVDLRPDGLTLTVVGLREAGQVHGLRVGPWSFGLTDPPEVTPGRPLTLRAGLPAGQCQDWQLQDAVPAGVQLLTHGPAGDRVTYVPIGPRLSRWLLAEAGPAWACS